MLVNRSPQAFKDIVEGEFVDKTGLLAKLNQFIKDCENFICLLEPRGFGKTTTANMINAYYSKGSSTQDIFDKLNIAQDPLYHKYLSE